jgi:3-hydroxyacyl-CoA dehydrogenase
MSNVVRYEATHRVAVLTVDNPPVNALGPGVLEAIEEAIARGLADPLVDALVLMGAGETFVAGADINLFKTIKSREQSLERSHQTHERLLRFEDATKPLVAAVHGNALGGGLELAMACHYRVATADARVGQPEVTLGIIPGAGGTQRLPRLAGAAMALEMCTEGKPEDGYAIRAGDIDVIYCHGFGFPRHRGGPMFYADTVGLTTVLAKVREYREAS